MPAAIAKPLPLTRLALATPLTTLGVFCGALMLATLWPAQATTTKAQANNLFKAGKYPQAYQAALKSSDYELACRAALIFAQYYQIAWADRAVTVGKKAVTTQPNSAAAHFALAQALGVQANSKGPSLAALSIARESRAAGEKALALNGQSAEIKAFLAAWHIGVWSKMGFLGGANTKLAKQYASTALRSAPNSIYVHSVLGQSFMDLKENKQAKKILQRAVQLKAVNAYEKELQKDSLKRLAKLK